MYLIRKNGEKKRIELKYRIKRKGDWDRNNKFGKQKAYTKPLGIIIIDGDELCFEHDEIFEIIKLYYTIDLESIRMIKDYKIDTGGENKIQITFLDKLMDYIKNNTHTPLFPMENEKPI